MSIEQDIRALLESANKPVVKEVPATVVQEELTDDQIVEEILALVELSKDTLSSYVDAAKLAVAKGANPSSHISRKDLLKRIRGVAKANKQLKMQKESLDSILEELEEDEVLAEGLMAITELSKDTLKDYVNRAVFDYVKNTTRANKGAPSTKSMKNRIHGIAVAQSKLKEHADILESLEMDDEVIAEDKTIEEKQIKVDVTEDVNALLNGEDQLTEEFKIKAATIFEAAVVTRVKEEISKLEESYDSKLATEVVSIKEGIAEKVDGYLNYIIEQWIIDNEIALTNGVKAEMMENFINGMKNVFEENYIDVPEEKFDVLSSMEQKVVELETKLSESAAKNDELSVEVNGMKKSSFVTEASQGLTEVDSEKFVTLAEELTFEDEVSFKGKLKTIRENYFTKKSTKKLTEEFITDETIVEEVTAPKLDSLMSKYVSAIK